MIRNTRQVPAGGIVLGAAILAACGGSERPDSPDGVTFTRDIAPLVFEHCTGCHRPDGSAPFDLVTYQDVESHATDITTVTRRGFMPPWLPEPMQPEFVGERRLTPEQVDLFRRWVKGGAARGDPADLPDRPRWTAGWQLGEPDLVVRMAEPYALAAEGRDIFRNFVIAVPVERTRYVRAIELHPGNRKIVHHAVIRIDRTPASRRLDALDAEPGFGGMEMGQSEPPDGHFLGWTPGRTAHPGSAGMAWRLDRGTDLVMQLHMLPTGKPETIRPEIGFYFSDEPPTLHPSVVTLYNNDIDIPAGESSYVLEDSFELPVDVELLGVYPHAHYLGQRLTGLARLPDGSERPFIDIPDWNFDWQDEYRYVEPLPLPAGTTLTLRYVYDNSADNVRNPNIPPRRVRYGNQSTDEMGSLAIQMLTSSDADRTRLDEAEARWLLEKVPTDWEAHNNLGTALLAQGRAAQAIEHFDRAILLQPELDEAHYNLGLALARQGRIDEAIARYREALRINPDLAQAENNLGNALLDREAITDAVEHYRRAVELRPDFDEAHYNLGNALLRLDRPGEAIGHYREALRVNPNAAMTHNNLGVALEAAGHRDEALAALRKALEIDPDLPDARRNLEALSK